MIGGLIKGGLKLGIGIVKFAANEVKERVAGGKAVPRATSPAAPENRDVAQDEEVYPEVPIVEIREMRALIDGENPPLLLDCRELHEWQAGAIDGCLHIPMNDLPDRVGELDPSRATIVYCLHGMRSAQIAGWLKANKSFRDVRSLEGGIVSWYAEYDQERIVVRRSEDI